MERTRKGGKRVCEKNALQNFKNILNPLYNNGSTGKKNDIIIKSV